MSEKEQRRRSSGFLKRIYYRLIRRKTVFTLISQSQSLLLLSNFNWYSSSDEPYFYLSPNHKNVYPYGWLIITVELLVEDSSQNFIPQLQIDIGEGFQHNLQIALPYSQPGKIEGIIRLPNNVQRLRFAPTNKRGNIQISKFEIVEINTIEVIARYAWILATVLLQNPTYVIGKARKLYMLWHQNGLAEIRSLIASKVQKNQLVRVVQDASQWYNQIYKPNLQLLAEFRAYSYSEESPKFSVLMPVYNTPKDWLSQAVMSVVSQTYTRWELLCVNDGSTLPHVQPLLDKFAALDKRIKIIHLEKNCGVSTASNIGLKSIQGDYVCFLDHDDYLEPQALHRFAETVITAHPDLIYSDEILTSNDLDTVLHVVVRPAFSYDYYISHPYFVHFIGVRAELLQKVGGFDETLKVSQDYDLILRVLEKAKTVSHVPDILYRWRTHSQSLSSDKKQEVVANALAAISRHLLRLGYNAQVQSSASFNFYDVKFKYSTPTKVAVIIPTKNREDLLKKCIDSLERTVLPETADIYVIDHESENPTAQLYLTEVAARHRVIPYKGPFNFSAIMNFGIASINGYYSHYLFLNNDIEAIEKGWLEHMLALARRREVGIVGATLLYPNQTIQHAGIIVGAYGTAEHAHKFDSFYCKNGERNLGFNGTLLSNRDFSAVTAACLLMRADVFHQIGGFDEQLTVGYGDVDLCLRIRDAGYKVLLDAYAVLIHYEGASRGKTLHKEDSYLFASRYRHIIINCSDPYFSPLLSQQSAQFELNLFAKSPQKTEPRTVAVILPQPH